MTRARAGGASAVRIASVYPVLLGTYGDGGNVLTLCHRARLRGLDVEVIEVQPGARVPTTADIYVMGGGEDTAQVAASEALRADRGLHSAAIRGAAILAICAGYQLLGRYFPDAQGEPARGLDLIDIETSRLPSRAVGEVAADPRASVGVPPACGGEAPLLARDRFTGYENHAGGTTRGPGVRPLGLVLHGVGNGDGTEGSVVGRIIGTYLHGPCLVRNPLVADQLLSWAIGSPLAPVAESAVEELRAERFRKVLGSR